MGYKDPTTVLSPKSRWEFGKALCNTGQGGWSIAEGWWEGVPALGIRWNGDDDSGSPGNPQSHGNPTWFILPEELREAARELAHCLAEAIDFVTFKNERPEGFDYGVFRVTMSIRGKIRERIEGRNVTFEIPTLPKRFFRHEDMKFMMPPTSDRAPWRGRFVDGEWTAIVQTNGISEQENPTSMDVVRDALIAQVVRALEPWKPTDIQPRVAHRAL
jgi:hypothetical protein